VAVLLVWAGKRFALRDGRLFALYVAAYTVGRAWVEALRVDHANHFLGLRLNDWTSLVVFVGAVLYLILRRPRPNAETDLTPAAGGTPHLPAPAPGPNPPEDPPVR
jgi:prolipoprotein diacylglyceryltransferase